MVKESLGYTALDIAKWFINSTDRESGDAITHLKVQKLLYYAQGWALAYFEKPLFDEELQAWAHGPVAVSVWEQFKGQGYQSLPEQKVTRRITGDALLLLQSVNERYGIYSAKKLEQMTHGEDPWKETRGDLPPEARCNAIIAKASIKKYFADLKP
ncbi:Panacea domain-containing protein [Microvirga lotononidis]|uniref:Putative phage-associated protein n=1 Tax=Microvirga lotononidis TaxID=864069 RepID=I4YMN3_9HYPH|nr:type II toxin-antitoxin system antitoxin SocA domain-containing protein [Microvirga lotononidis]EIM25225.1 putative phage-associated protein [Microvirga lotononidis]WQO29289.1 DUF4065 domain-containing protein [Microvirga lotononidis]